tara:strand:- start:101 stop:646 length:546 start_codon:yes stop_codon:yes gene_type:complete
MSVFYADGAAYRCTVTNQVLTKSKEKGTPCLLLTVVPNVFLAANGDEEDLGLNEQFCRLIYIYITEKTIDYALEDLARLGFSGNKFSQLNPDNDDHHSFVGDVVECYCKHETYEGETRERWRLSSRQRAEALDDKQLSELDVLFGKQMKSRFGNGSSTKRRAKQQNATAAAAQANDDDAPF